MVDSPSHDFSPETDDRVQMTDSPGHDFSPGSRAPKLSAVDPASAAENFYSYKTTRAYKCGKCCGLCCCTTKYTCCGGKDDKCGCTPYTTAQGLGAGASLAGAGSGVGTSCMAGCGLCCGTRACPCALAPSCGALTGAETGGIVVGGFFGVALVFGCQVLSIWLCDKYCGRLTMKLGCPKFSRGFDERDE